MYHISPITWIMVAAGGLISGFVDSIAGGGGLISVPVLLAAGLPPHLALGTNKIQSSFGSFTAAWRYGKKGLIPWKSLTFGIVFSLGGAAAGSWAVSRFQADSLERLLPFLLLAVWLSMVFKKNKDIESQERPALIPSKLFYPPAGLFLGFYDGFLGPGTGAYWTVSQFHFLGKDLKKATTATKPLNFASNVGSLFVFLLAGHVVFSLGLVMAACQVLGAFLGSRLVIRRPPQFIRPFFLAVVAGTLLKLLYDQYLSP